ncbi:hypothetical protein CBR_g29939 [Chara braunii]|uniref:Uncharacterized protein n=1 Tax=Chara braunii TaxID=69332 RepID=A0A388LBK7_CHABU|nr:hypothetical protein CBR_g29939 [Chara braunii]|eukprot:GBG79674.1 hypothetical protein CBR_g29939 [Chara braunii]
MSPRPDNGRAWGGPGSNRMREAEEEGFARGGGVVARGVGAWKRGGGGHMVVVQGGGGGRKTMCEGEVKIVQGRAGGCAEVVWRLEEVGGLGGGRASGMRRSEERRRRSSKEEELLVEARRGVGEGLARGRRRSEDDVEGGSAGWARKGRRSREGKEVAQRGGGGRGTGRSGTGRSRLHDGEERLQKVVREGEGRRGP